MKKVKKVQYISEDFLSPKDAWSKLSLEEKSDVIRQGVENGMSQLADIKKAYNNSMKDALDKVNESEAPFVERLKDPDRKSIEAWEKPGDIATHRLGVGTDENNNHYIYPQVQEIDGKLIDYSRPPYSPFAGMISAEERGDTVRVPSIEEGIAFTEHYKDFYPKGNTFKKGGLKLNPGVKNGDKVETDQCAAFSNGFLRDNGYLISGDAWGLKGVDMIFNGFEGLDRPQEYKAAKVREYNHNAAQNVYDNFDSKTLDKTRPYVVNMFYNNSPAQKTAYEAGNDVTGTHTGLLLYDEDAKKWKVTHNIHGTIHQDDFIPLQSGKGKYGVTAIYSPREATLMNYIKTKLGKAYGGPLIQQANSL